MTKPYLTYEEKNEIVSLLLEAAENIESAFVDGGASRTSVAKINAAKGEEGARLRNLAGKVQALETSRPALNES